MSLWFATGNAHKKGELEAILAEGGIDWAIKIPREAGFEFDPQETGDTFLANALLKAGELYRLIVGRGERGPVIADDSGLCVDALGGRPGVYSARYGGGEGKLSAPDRNVLLLRELGNAENRKARFVCAMVLFYSPDRFFIAQETLEGELLRETRGSGGFGYDPILYLPERGLTVAELSAGEKNRISHRGKAGQAIARLLAGG